MSKRFPIIAFMLGMALVAVAADPAAAPQPAQPRVIDKPDLAPIIKRVANPKGYGYDPGFLALISKPSPYYTDFFGIQALKDLTKKKIEQDFVPKYASVVKDGDNSLELKFKSGWSAKFYVNSTLEIMGLAVPFDHVYISGDTYGEIEKNIDEFREILKAQQLEDTYLIKNPYYAEELEAQKRLDVGDASSVTVTSDPDLKQFSQQKTAVWIYPDGVHGNYTAFKDFYNVLKTADFDWLGLEALPIAMQKTLDTFIDAKEGSAEYIQARKTLLSVLSNGWDKRFGLKGPPEEGPFFKTLELMRERGKHVYGLDAPLEYTTFRYGETPFGGAVRGDLWARSVPMTGRGIVFGGSAHFMFPQSVNFQDFLHLRNREVKFYSVTKIEPRPQS